MAKRKPKPVATGEAPTPERMNHGEFSQGGIWATDTNERAGLAYRQVPVILTLLASHRLTQRQYDALSRYRGLAVAEDRSYRRDSLDMSIQAGGGSLGLPPGMVTLQIGNLRASELGWLEHELGSLRTIARAIAVDDVSLSAWAITQAGSKERRRTVRNRVVTLFEPPRAAYKRALTEIRIAGERLAAAIGV